MKSLYFLVFFCLTPALCNAQTKSIEKITAYIDSLYNITSEFKVDSNSDGKVLLHNRKPALKKYYSYISFNFYAFKNEQEATNIFDSLVMLSKVEPRDFIEKPEFINTFPKGGCTYILYQNTIVMHHRRCNYMPIDNTRENEFVKFLFNNSLPKRKYFLQVDCGWDHPKVK